VLDVVVADKVKLSALREHGRFVVDGAITEVVRKTRADAVPVNELEQLTVAKDGARLRAEDQKGVASALNVTNENCWEAEAAENKSTERNTAEKNTADEACKVRRTFKMTSWDSS